MSDWLQVPPVPPDAPLPTDLGATVGVGAASIPLIIAATDAAKEIPLVRDHPGVVPFITYLLGAAINVGIALTIGSDWRLAIIAGLTAAVAASGLRSQASAGVKAKYETAIAGMAGADPEAKTPPVVVIPPVPHETPPEDRTGPEVVVVDPTNPHDDHDPVRAARRVSVHSGT